MAKEHRRTIGRVMKKKASAPPCNNCIVRKKEVVAHIDEHTEAPPA
jgi:hypothetical protein